MRAMTCLGLTIIPFAVFACAGSSDDNTGSGGQDVVAAAAPALHPSIVGTWGRSGMAEGPDGPVSIVFDDHNSFDSVYRVDQHDVERKGTWKRIFGDVTGQITYVGPDDKPPAFLKNGDFLLVQFDLDTSDLFAVRFEASNQRVVLNFLGGRRGQGLKVDGSKGPDVALQKNFNGSGEAPTSGTSAGSPSSSGGASSCEAIKDEAACQKNPGCDWFTRPQQGDVGSVCVDKACEDITDMDACQKSPSCEWLTRPQQGDVGSVCIAK